jgi:hypothetical protein
MTIRAWNKGKAGGSSQLEGYTLFEILLTLGIMAIALGVTTPLVMSLLSVSPAEAIIIEIQEVATATHRDAVAGGESRRIHVTCKGLQEAAGGSVLLPEGWELQLKRFSETRFRKPGEAEFWEFNGAGICEPLELMLSDGEESIRVAFDPLSAEVLSDEK